MTTMNEVADYLTHHGVKGQKWGVRRREKKLAKADSKWEKKSEKRSAMFSIYNAAAEAANADLPGINARWARVNLKKVDPATQARYHKEVTDNFNKHMAAAADAHGLSPSGKKKLEASYDADTGLITVSAVDIEHADNNVELLLEKDENGLITKITVPEVIMAQSATEFVEMFLEHHGVKGQKWGVRNKRRTPSADAQRHSGNRKKHVSELDDKELQQLINRMNMHQQYKRLNPPKVAKGHAMVKTILAAGVTANAVVAFGKTPTGKALATSLAKKTRAFNPALGGLKALG